jgi:3',5'-cyclic AMP phosphodiesterase CpdA
VVSGDLTQRAKSEQFEEARPGSTPCRARRSSCRATTTFRCTTCSAASCKPLDRYKRYITDDLDPVYVDDEIAVLGVNTARSLTFKDGRVNKEQVAKIREPRWPDCPEVTRIVVTHHPFDLPKTFEEDDLVDRAPMAMEVFAECGVDLLLAGHLHMSHAGNTAGALQDQRVCGAGGAGRHGDLDARAGRSQFLQRAAHRAERIEVDRYGWDACTTSSAVIVTEKFMRSGNVWAPVSEGRGCWRPGL